MFCNSTLGNLPNTEWSTMLGSLMCLIAVTATLENLIVLIVIYKYSVLHTTSNIILASLAMADFLTGCTVAPLNSIQYFSPDILQNCVVEGMRRYLSTALIGASTLSLGFVSYDRCLHLVMLQKYKMKKKVLYTTISLCWLVPILLPLLRKINDTERVYSATIITIGTINLITILISYLGVILSLRYYSGRCSSERLHQSATDNEKRAGITVVIIITLYIFMMVPVFVYHGLNSTNLFDRYLLAKVYNISMLLAIFNSTVNPLVYCYRTMVLKKYTNQLLIDFLKASKLRGKVHHRPNEGTVEFLI